MPTQSTHVSQTLNEIADRLKYLQHQVEPLQQEIDDLKQAQAILLRHLGHKPAVSMATSVYKGAIPAGTTSATRRRFIRPSPRKESVAKLLQEAGPLKRSEIVERLHLPVGTVSFVLIDKNRFARTQDGRWTIASAGRG